MAYLQSFSASSSSLFEAPNMAYLQSFSAASSSVFEAQNTAFLQSFPATSSSVFETQNTAYLQSFYASSISVFETRNMAYLQSFPASSVCLFEAPKMATVKSAPAAATLTSISDDQGPVPGGRLPPAPHCGECPVFEPVRGAGTSTVTTGSGFRRKSFSEDTRLLSLLLSLFLQKQTQDISLL